jgi:hypothetical protein
LVVKDLDTLLSWKLDAKMLPGNLKNKAIKLAKWQEVRNTALAAIEEWTDVDGCGRG